MAVKDGIIPRKTFFYLADHGAVSEPVVRAMAEGALGASGADYALAVTGVEQLTLMCGDELRKLRPELEMLKATVNNDILHKEEEIARLKEQATTDETELDNLRHDYANHAAAGSG